jgi:hypothetical protein
MPSFNIGQVGGLLRNLGGQASRFIDRNIQKDIYGAWQRTGVPLRRLAESRAGIKPLSRLDEAKAFANTRTIQGLGGATGLAALGSFTGNIEDTLNQIGPAVDRTVSSIVPDNIENWAGRTARELEKGGLMGLSGAVFSVPFAAAQTLNQPGGYNTAQRPVGTLSQLGGNEVAWRGPDLGWQRTYSEGANPPPPAPGSLQDLSSGRRAGQVGSSVISNGAGVPAQRSDVINRALSQEVLNAAQQFNAPANVPLPSFYEGQQQLGRSMMQNGTLVSQLQELGGAPGMTPENLKSWAEKNPALAYRELLKRRGVQ